MQTSTATTMRVPFVDLAAQHTAIKAELLEAMGRVIDSGMYVLGAEVAEGTALFDGGVSRIRPHASEEGADGRSDGAQVKVLLGGRLHLTPLCPQRFETTAYGSAHSKLNEARS